MRYELNTGYQNFKLNTAFHAAEPAAKIEIKCQINN